MTLNAGLSLDTVSPELRGLVESGIHNAAVRALPPGMRLYRFASDKLDRAFWPAGPWWVDRSTFNHIVQQAIRQPAGFGVGWSARRALAIRQQWSRVNILVEAEVAEKIYVFHGRGTTQYREPTPNGMYITWEAWRNVEQLFLPYISDRHGLTPLGRRALHIYRMAQISSFQLYSCERK